MHPADIKAKLEKKGLSSAEIARRLGCSPNAVSLVIYNRMTSKRIAVAVSAEIGVPAYRLWPERYPEEIAA